MSTEGPEIPEDVMQTAFNDAINYAIDQGCDAAEFLIAWREGGLDEIIEAYPDFDMRATIASQDIALVERTKSTAAHAAGYREGLEAAAKEADTHLPHGHKTAADIRALIPPSTPEPSRSADEALQTLADLGQEFDAAVERDAVRGLVKALKPFTSGPIWGLIKAALVARSSLDLAKELTRHNAAADRALTAAKEARIPGTEDGV